MQSTNLLVMSIYASMNEGSVIYGRGRTFHLVQIPFISKSARHTICIQAPDRLAIIYVLYIHYTCSAYCTNSKSRVGRYFWLKLVMLCVIRFSLNILMYSYQAGL